MKTKHTPVVAELFQTLVDLKIAHWNTLQYAEHKALDEAHSSISSILDTVAETTVGTEGPLEIFSLKTPMCLTPDLPNCILDNAKNLKSFASTKYPDLANTADELTSVGNKLKYLLRLS
jgi:hypothetical protein